MNLMRSFVAKINNLDHPRPGLRQTLRAVQQGRYGAVDEIAGVPVGSTQSASTVCSGVRTIEWRWERGRRSSNTRDDPLVLIGR